MIHSFNQSVSTHSVPSARPAAGCHGTGRRGEQEDGEAAV